MSWGLQHLALSSGFNGLNCSAQMRRTSIQAQLGACCIGSLLNHTLCWYGSGWYMYAGPSWIDCLMRQSPYKQILSSFATCEFVFKSFTEQITCENLLFVGSNQLIKIFVKFQLTSFWSCPPCQHANIYYIDSCVPLSSCQESLSRLVMDSPSLNFHCFWTVQHVV